MTAAHRVQSHKGLTLLTLTAVAATFA